MEQPGALQTYPDPRSHSDQQPPFWIQFQPWAVDVAAHLYRQFGDELDLRVRILPYPMPEVFELPTPPEQGSAVRSDEFVASLDQPVEVESGHTVRTSVAIKNRGSGDVEVNTSGWVKATVVDPVTNRAVSAFAGAERAVLVR